MRASTCGRRMSLASSSSRCSSTFMRERRSVNSQDARSIIASARRELRISCSMVSSSTRLSLASGRPFDCTGSAPSRVCETVPLCSASRRSVVMPAQPDRKRFCWTTGDLAPLQRRHRLGDGCRRAGAHPGRRPATTAGIPSSRRSAYDRLACCASAVGLAGVGMGWECDPSGESRVRLYTTAPAFGSSGSCSLAAGLTRSSRLTPSHIAMAAATNTDE